MRFTDVASIKYFRKLSLVPLLLVMGCQQSGESTSLSNTNAAREWLESVQIGKAETIATVEKLMADDGVAYANRYVGLGITIDTRPEVDGVVLMDVNPDGPAAGILEIGDKFVSVRGVPATVENRNAGRLNFRGQPGEAVPAVISRDGKNIEVSINRGVIETGRDKKEFIEWLNLGDEEDWSNEEMTINEIVSQGNVSYAWVTIKNTDEATGLPWESHIVRRFVFNEQGQITATSQLQEDRFVLEQQGFTISR
ncbi:MAG: hypothetical protein O3C15_09125 [Proteobacteria bacterium]|nr:hypothetical protein [Pseudomonadota bacterium]